MDSHRKGELTEAVVIAELKKRGIPVSQPFGDNERYDIVVETPAGALLRVQIKTGWNADGCVNAKGVSQHTNSRGNVYKEYSGDVDWFLVYSHEGETMYWIGEDEFGTKIRLRVEDPKQEHRTINWAENFEFDERWPPDERPSDLGDQKRTAVREAIDALEATGATVLRPVNEDDPRNLVAETGEGLYRVRVENGWVSEGRIRFDPNVEGANCYVVYCEETDGLYAVGDDAFEESISLRVEPTDRLRDDLNLAADYELKYNWPPGSNRRTPDDVSHPAVATVVDALESEGYGVEFAEESGSRRSLLVSREDDQYRVRVESGYTTDGRLLFNANGSDEVDYYIVYHSEANGLYVVADEAFNEAMSLRIEPPERVDDSINWADDYAFADNWPPE